MSHVSEGGAEGHRPSVPLLDSHQVLGVVEVQLVKEDSGLQRLEG